MGLGLFAAAFLGAGSVLGEYTGVLSRRRSEEDGVYGYGLPVVEPDLVINAKEPWRMVDLGLRFEEMVIFC